MNFKFPDPVKLERKLLDFLEEEVELKYFLSEDFILYATDMTNRNGYIRGVRFRPHDNDSKYAYTITTSKGTSAADNFIIVPENTLRGYREAFAGDGIYINRPHQKRGVVQIGMIHTIKRSVNDLGVIIEKNGGLAIRRLTPRESFRLMGWTDDRIDLIINEFSDTQLYNMAGNGIAINVLVHIFRELFKVDYE
jgi:DNA (cytosine-5)-methyltransferase 1